MVGLCSYANGSQVIGSPWVCVCVCMCVGVCVLVGTQPSVSGKHCHSYINKPDRGDRHWVGRFFVGWGVEEGMDGERTLRWWKVVH